MCPPFLKERMDKEKNKKQIRLASIVIFATILIWMFAQWLGGQLGLPARFVFLFDFAAMASFAWALYVLWKAWRKSQ
ncbi:MAG: DUF5337 domain-containing protein [Pseudomonadota bacterium]